MNKIQKNKTFGVIYTWPGTVSAEMEFICRLKKAAENLKYNMIIISNKGSILDENMNFTDYHVNPEDLLFIIDLHYDDRKYLDCFYYHALWNPPEFILRWEPSAYINLIRNIISNNDYLTYDSGGFSDHLKTLLHQTGKEFCDNTFFVSSLPKSDIFPPNLNNPRLFYCGMNWDVLFKSGGRHFHLFKYLDNTNIISFFGPNKPKAWNGIRPWKGYKCYKGEVPFDGFSILKKINECGIALAISSNSHRKAGGVTNRFFEACAAGAVIISDENEFIRRNFGDSVLYINYNCDDPYKNYIQIMEKYEWINNNKEKALQLANNCQKIFVEKYSLEVLLNNIFLNHSNRSEHVFSTSYSLKRNEEISIIYFYDNPDLNNLKSQIKNIERQTYKKLKFIVIMDNNQDLNLNDLKTDLNIYIYKNRIYDSYKNRILSRFQQLRSVVDKFNSDYFIILDGNEIFFKDHIDLLKRKIESDDNVAVCYSGLFRRYNKEIKVWDSFGLDYNDFLNFKLVPSGRAIINKKIFEYIPIEIDRYIDGLEFQFIINTIVFNTKFDIKFSDMLTCAINGDLPSYPSHFDSRFDYKYQENFIRGFVYKGYKEKFLDISLGCKNGLNSTLLNKELGSVLACFIDIKIILLKIKSCVFFYKRKKINVEIHNLRTKQYAIKKQIVKFIKNTNFPDKRL